MNYQFIYLHYYAFQLKKQTTNPRLVFKQQSVARTPASVSTEIKMQIKL